MSVVILTNPTSKEIDALGKFLPQENGIVQKIKRSNTRAELIESDDYSFVILYLPEYNQIKKSIQSVEVNVHFHKKSKQIYLFAYNTEYFFERYREQIMNIEYKGFGGFIKKLLDIILEDEGKIVEHIVQDSENIKEEYMNKVDTYEIIRHLTRNEINISSLKLISTTQNKLLDLLEKHIPSSNLEAIEYKRTYVAEELEYEHEFCKALMDSINTKFQVRSSEELSLFTKFSFVIFVCTLIVAFLTLAHADDTVNKIYTFISLFLCIASGFVILAIFKKH